MIIKNEATRTVSFGIAFSSSTSAFLTHGVEVTVVVDVENTVEVDVDVEGVVFVLVSVLGSFVGALVVTVVTLIVVSGHVPVNPLHFLQSHLN